jgi:uncharacterized protein (DUF305 family)
MKSTILAAILAAFAAFPATAQHAGHQGMPMMMQGGQNMQDMSAMMSQMSEIMARMSAMMAAQQPAPKGDTGAASSAYAEANAKMHAAMDITYTGDADVDFVNGMIAHHQGAIDMARVVIEHGKDADIRKLAQEIVTAQEGEIAFMREWLARHGK